MITNRLDKTQILRQNTEGSVESEEEQDVLIKKRADILLDPRGRERVYDHYHYAVSLKFDLKTRNITKKKVKYVFVSEGLWNET